MAILMRRWERARQGDGQLVLIVGKPGLGKCTHPAKAAFLIRFISSRVTWILGVVRARSVHKTSYGHNPDGAAP